MKRYSRPKTVILTLAAVFLCQVLIGGEMKTKVKVSFFSGILKDSGRVEKLPGEKLETLKFNTFNEKENLVGQIKRALSDKIEILCLESLAESELPFQKEAFEKINWLKDEFIIKIMVDEKPGAASLFNGKIVFTNTKRNEKYVTPFSLEKEKGIIAFLKKGENILLLAIRKKEKKEAYPMQPIHHTEFRTGNAVIYSLDSSWSDSNLSADVIVFNKAKAVITAGKKNLVLLGEKIVYSSTDECITGLNAILKDPNGKKLGEGKTITISLKPPFDFKIE